MATATIGRVGDYIREQREAAAISVRRLAKEAGVSNPYLSQVERGLRKPSAEVLQQIAKALRISAEQLYVQAGLLEDRGTPGDVVAAILGDETLSDRHKRALIDIYVSFRAEAGRADVGAPDAPVPNASRPRSSTRTPKAPRSARTTTKG